jgi:hypothetical protein
LVPEIDEQRFRTCDWSANSPGASEKIPTNAPEPHGKSVTMTCYVNADHAGCLATRPSHTGVIILVNNAPILWYSMRRNTVKSSTFGSEFIEGPTNLFGDNMSVVINATYVESQLKMKHNAIAYHRIREAIASGFVWFTHEPGVPNLADILSKPIPGPRLRGLSRRIMF